jgi:geranylgeranylglycerol-phosphate geranylgeranyltransferase
MKTAMLKVWSSFERAADGLRLRIEIARAQCSIAAGVYVVLGVYVSGVDSAWTDPRTWAGCLAAMLAVAAAFVYNDVRDEAVDRRSRPERPIPSGRLARASALHLSAALAIASGAAAAWSSAGALVPFIAAYVLLSVWYSHVLKGTVLLGNATVAALVASLPIYGGVTAGNVNDKLLVASLVTFLFCLAQEILFTLEDVKGDGEAGLQTTATSLGAAGSLRLFRASVVLLALACLAPWYFGLATGAYGVAVLVCTVVPTLLSGFLLRPDAGQRELAAAATVMRFTWCTSVVPFVLLR